MKSLILGGARSGKSRLAEQLAACAHRQGKQLHYIATATAGDEEMRERIAHHRQDRQARQLPWQLHEEPLALAARLTHIDKPNQLILVDCLTLWCSNLLLAEPGQLESAFTALYQVIPKLHSDLILVSNETGLGVVPADPLSRRFVDESGRLHQQLAQQCDRLVYCLAGIPQVFKGPPLPALA